MGMDILVENWQYLVNIFLKGYMEKYVSHTRFLKDLGAIGLNRFGNMMCMHVNH